ncbi:MAG: hypothetical protein WDZ94_00480 [Patescibacteria group bacterium]
MKRIPTLLFVLLLASIVGFFYASQPVLAQTDVGTGLAHTFQINEPVSSGDIIVVKDAQYMKSAEPYSADVVGVVAERPAVVFVADDGQGTPMLKAGITNVKVSMSNGEIRVGDYITTSQISGVAMKATKSGFVIGVAEGNFSTSNPEEIGLLPVNLQFNYMDLSQGTGGVDSDLQRSLWDILSLNRLAASESPGQMLKYTVAALLLIASFGFGFYIFGRTANKGIDAIGRNPLAGKLIGFSVVLNVVLTVVIIGAGVGLSYLIIVF